MPGTNRTAARRAPWSCFHGPSVGHPGHCRSSPGTASLRPDTRVSEIHDTLRESRGLRLDFCVVCVARRVKCLGSMSRHSLPPDADLKELASATFRSWRGMANPRTVLGDLSAALTVAMVALPLNLALAVACGLPPHAGLLSAAAAGAIGALFGSSRFQITGPEVALAPMTLVIVSEHGLGGLIAATVLAGLVQIVLGFLRVGGLVRAIPRPVVGGFMAAVGLLVFDTQLPRLLGIEGVPRISAIRDPAHLVVHWPALGVGLLAIGILLGLRRAPRSVPVPLLALIAAVLVTFVFDLPVQRIEPLEGASLLPTLPNPSELDLVALLPSALGLAFLASLDSLLCAVSIDARTGERHHSDRELIAQGLANVVSGFVGGMPVAAAVVRSVVAVESRAETRLAALAQSALLLVIVLVLGAHLDHIPLAALAGVLLVVGGKLIQVGELRALQGIAKLEAAVFVVTAAAILAFDFVPGVAVGVGLSLAVLAYRARGTLRVRRGSERAGVRIVEVSGALFSGSQDRLRDLLEPEVRGAERAVLDLSGMHSLDASGLAALRAAAERLRASGVSVGVGGAPGEGLAMLQRELRGACVCVHRDLDLAVRAVNEGAAWRADEAPTFLPVAAAAHALETPVEAPAE